MELLVMRVSEGSLKSDRFAGSNIQVLGSDGGRKSGKGDKLVSHVDGVLLFCFGSVVVERELWIESDSGCD